MDELERGASLHFVRCISQQALDGGTFVTDDSLAIENRDDVGAVFHQRAKMNLPGT